ncbi:MAG TPA: AI-2E family transporter [Bdellovibrionales bacterium]|nr:AI-2E family transporter [Bdellovibrionales bacterium]
MSGVNLKQIIASIAFLALGVVLFLIGFETRSTLLIAVVGIGLGVLLAPLITIMQTKFHIPRALAALLLLLFVVIGVGIVGWAIFDLVTDQARALLERAPQIAEMAKERLERVLASQPWLEPRIRSLDLADEAQATARTLFSGLQLTLTAIIGMALVFIIGLYTALNSNAYFKGFLSLFPAYERPRVTIIMNEAGTQLRRWFRSQLMVMTVTAIITTIALKIIGIDFWLLLGILTGAFGIIPFIGAFLTGALTVLVALGTQPEQVWWVLALYLAIQQIEAHVTVPIIMRGGVELPEIHLIILMLVLSQIFGIMGVLIAPPLLAVGRSIYLMTYVPKMNDLRKPPAKTPLPARI